MSTKALIVEPQALWREIAHIYFESWGFEVTTAADAAAGMGILADGDFDVVLAGLELPDAPGFDLLAAARSRNPAMPVFLTSESWPESARRRAESRGAVAVRYPCDWAGLLNKLRQALEKRSGGADEEAAPPGA